MNTRYRRAVLAGNWKMNLLSGDVKPYALRLRELAKRRARREVLVCVPFPLIPAAVRAFRGSHIAVGAQDVSEEPKGARTGEVSAAQLRDAGVKYVIVGHSERRQYHGETDGAVSRKLAAVHGEGMTPILCVGETLEQRELGIQGELIAMQVKAALSGLPEELLRRTIIAYEPIWAIGTGRTASPEQAQEMCALIRSTLRLLYGARAARAVPVLYGGSMNGDNAEALLRQPDVDGGLVGGASLDPEKFFRIIAAADRLEAPGTALTEE
ncbi:MAG: triose-phosphate isomerase [Oscillospiraceae bacterium]|nr:triose-phosphate isomerase [Oscillospiraceae bacterium]